jgi:hypothetical protein
MDRRLEENLPNNRCASLSRPERHPPISFVHVSINNVKQQRSNRTMAAKAGRQSRFRRTRPRRGAVRFVGGGVLPPSQPRVNRLFRPGPSSFPGSFRKRRTGQKPTQFNTMDQTQRPSRGPRQPNRQKRPRRREGGFYRPNPNRSTQEFDPPQTFFAPPKTPDKKHRIETLPRPGTGPRPDDHDPESPECQSTGVRMVAVLGGMPGPS